MRGVYFFTFARGCYLTRHLVDFFLLCGGFSGGCYLTHRLSLLNKIIFDMIYLSCLCTLAFIQGYLRSLYFIRKVSKLHFRSINEKFFSPKLCDDRAMVTIVVKCDSKRYT